MKENSKTNERLLFVDIVKTLSMLWIVGYWHLNYAIGPSHISPTHWWDGYLTNVCLGAFMFFSGFCLSKYKFSDFKKNAINFYKKRFVRLYPLYVLSIISLFSFPYIQAQNYGAKVMLTSLLGISTYFQPQPPTLWFLSMLISFYIITPFVMTFEKLYQRVGVIVIIILIGFLLDSIVPQGIDKRFFWYCPLYFCGLLFGAYEIGNKYLNKLIAISLPISLIILFYMYDNHVSYGDISLVQLIFILTSVIVFAWFVSKTDKLRFWKPLLMLSNCSMCAYLFHRQIYEVLYTLYELIGLDFGYWFTAITFIPICLSISFCIQKCYDGVFLPWMTKLLFRE